MQSPLAQGLSQPLLANFDSNSVVVLLSILALLSLSTRVVSELRFQLQKRRTAATGEIQEPKLYPYWIPYFGHAFSFGTKQNELLLSAYKSTGDGVVALNMGNRRHNMVFKPSLTRQIFLQRPSVLTSDDLVDFLSKRWFDLANIDSLRVSAEWKELNGALHAMMREPFLKNGVQTLVTGVESAMPGLVSFAPSLVDQTPWERTARVAVLPSESACTEQSSEVDLWPLLRNFVGTLATNALMGPILLENSPGFLEDLWTFDSSTLLFFSGIPRWIPHPAVSRDYNARSRLHAALVRWRDALMSSEDGGEVGAEWTGVEEVSSVMKQRHVAWCARIDAAKGPRAKASEKHYAAAGDLSVIWAMNANANNIFFWLVLEIYNRPSLLSSLRSEISPYVTATQDELPGLPIQPAPQLKIDIEGLVRACQLLKATFYETMRMHSAGHTYKTANADFTLTESEQDAALAGLQAPRTYAFKKGEYVVVPHNTHQHDPLYYPLPENFDPQRFLEKDEKGTLRADMRAIKPFGGGGAACKGRNFAEREVLAFAAGFMTLWEIEFPEGWKMPEEAQATAATKPKGNVRVKLRRRKVGNGKDTI